MVFEHTWVLNLIGTIQVPEKTVFYLSIYLGVLINLVLAFILEFIIDSVNFSKIFNKSKEFDYKI